MLLLFLEYEFECNMLSLGPFQNGGETLSLATKTFSIKLRPNASNVKTNNIN